MPPLPLWPDSSIDSQGVAVATQPTISLIPERPFSGPSSNSLSASAQFFSVLLRFLLVLLLRTPAGVRVPRVSGTHVLPSDLPDSAYMSFRFASEFFSTRTPSVCGGLHSLVPTAIRVIHLTLRCLRILSWVFFLLRQPPLGSSHGSWNLLAHSFWYSSSMSISTFSRTFGSIFGLSFHLRPLPPRNFHARGGNLEISVATTPTIPPNSCGRNYSRHLAQ